MIDQSFKSTNAGLPLPDFHVSAVRTEILVGQHTFASECEQLNRALFYFALRGDFLLEIEGTGSKPIEIKQGAAVGFQIGRRHRWAGLLGRPAKRKSAFQLFTSSIDRKAAFLQGLDDEIIIVPARTKRSSPIIAYAVQLHKTEFESTGDDETNMLMRRCAEIVQSEFVRFSRTGRSATGKVPVGMAHDEHLLRAWSAYFADPRRRWTVAALAKAAGLGRTTFSERFRDAMGAPPLTALTDLRLEQAVSLLKQGKTPLIEIAFTVGYNSEAAFVRAFARKYGVPPGRFRKELPAAVN